MRLAEDYGCDVTTAEGAARHLREIAPEPPLTRGRYVAIVRRVLDRQDLSWVPAEVRLASERHVDGRLIAAVYRDPAVRPREWCAGGRAEAWLRYWVRHAGRPGTVGSSLNPLPEHAARSWALGLSKVVRARGSRWTGQRERLAILLRVPDDGLEGVATADLRRWAKLSPAFRKWCVAPRLAFDEHARPSIDWQAVAEELARFRAAPRAELQALRVPAEKWRAVLALGSAELAVHVVRAGGDVEFARAALFAELAVAEGWKNKPAARRGDLAAVFERAKNGRLVPEAATVAGDDVEEDGGEWR